MQMADLRQTVEEAQWRLYHSLLDHILEIEEESRMKDKKIEELQRQIEELRYGRGEVGPFKV